MIDDAARRLANARPDLADAVNGFTLPLQGRFHLGGTVGGRLGNGRGRGAKRGRGWVTARLMAANIVTGNGPLRVANRRDPSGTGFAYALLCDHRKNNRPRPLSG